MNELPLVCLISPSRESVPSRWSIGNSILKTPRRFPAFPHGKRQHVVETLNLIDQGTSILVDHHVRPDFTAEKALEAVAQTFAHQGLPTSITLDRDTRWVGAPQGSDFPSALVRFCQSLGVTVFLCDPHHPQPAWICGTLSSHAQSGVFGAVSAQDVG
jgi:hypothetical protein